MTQLQRLIERYGPVVGPKLYHARQSRAAYIGASRRRAAEITRLTGEVPRVRPARPEPREAPSLFDGAKSDLG